VSLDYSAAFDTVDHSILFDRLKYSFGFTGTAFTWLQSYLTGRSQFVKLGNHNSSSTSITTGVPQGSVLGPLLFTIYTSPIAAIASAHCVSQQQYADDTQLYIALSPNDSSTSIVNLELCLNDLYYWCCLNGLALNPDKTDSILLGTRQRANSYTDIATVKVADTSAVLKNKIKILGVTLDSHLTMDSQVSDICRSAFYHIRAMRHIRPTITDDVAKTIACSFVTSRLDYVNSALYGISAKNIHRLQRMQNTLARVVLGSSASKFSHSTDMLRYLHWLPVEYRIKFKLAKLVFNTRNNSAPLYLTCLLDDYVPGRSLRSSQSNLLTVPSYRLNFGARSFRVAAPTVWNSLPADIRACSLHSTFTCHLKTFYFNTAFN